MELRCQGLMCRAGAFVMGPVDLCLPPASCLALVGPNGSGKSTLLRALCGLLPSTGSLKVDGKELASLGARQRARALCLLPQQEESASAFTVEEFVLLGRHAHLGLLGHHGARDRAVVHDAMERTACLAWRERRMDTLSGGERQLVRLAAALAQEAHILLLDEPGTFLDPGQRSRLWTRLQAIRRHQALSLVWVTHDVNEALEHADQVLALEGGRMLRQGPVELLEEKAWVEQLFQVPLAMTRVEGRARPLLVEVTPNQGETSS